MELIILTGNIGCGKSTKALELAREGYVIINMDSIVTMVGGGDYKLYDVDKKSLYHAIELSILASSLSYGFFTVVDRTNMDIKRRGRYIEIGKVYNAEIISYNWGPGIEEDLIRRNKDNRGHTKKGYWNKVFEKFKKEYEEPSIGEGFDRIVNIGGGDE